VLTFLAAWKDVFEMVQEARIDRLLKLVPFAGAVLFSCLIRGAKKNAQHPKLGNFMASNNAFRSTSI